MNAVLLDKIIAAANEMPYSAVETLYTDFMKLPPNAKKDECLCIIDRVAVGEANHSLRQLVKDSMNKNEGLTPVGLAIALKSAAAMDEHWRKSASYELVWTGPCPKGSAFRRMDQALFDVINEAHEELLLVTYVTYKVPELNEGFEKAISRGVKVSLIIETETIGEMDVKQTMLKTFGEIIGQQANFYHWPMENRPKDSKNRTGSLHVKCALGDKNTLLLSSANLTGHAFNLNMEMGILIHNKVLAERVWEHFCALINEGAIGLFKFK